MVRFLSSVVASLAFGCATAALHDQAWRGQFRSKINVMPASTNDCSVCFYEQANFAGANFCIGKRDESCTKVNPISTPETIGSIKFSKGCDLVVNVRVTDPPYNEHVDVISEDIAKTDYNSTLNLHVVQEVYVEEAGRACFLGTPKTVDDFGKCYTDDVPAVDSEFRDSFNELMLFKTKTKDFDVVAYEKDNFNSVAEYPAQNDASEQKASALSYRFTGYSKDLETDKKDKSGMKRNMQGKVRSIRFVVPEDDAPPASVAPYSV